MGDETTEVRVVAGNGLGLSIAVATVWLTVTSIGRLAITSVGRLSIAVTTIRGLTVSVSTEEAHVSLINNN